MTTLHTASCSSAFRSLDAGHGTRTRRISRRLKAAAAVTMGVLSFAAAQAGLGAADAQAAWVGGIESGAVASFSTCTQSVSGSAYTMSSLQGDGVWARAWVYDYPTAQWYIGAWVPADGITRFAIGTTSPYKYMYVEFARYVNGWRYAAEYQEISANLDNGFCQ